MFGKIVALIFLVHGASAVSTNVTVDGLGNVIGLKETTAWTQRTIYSFRGIPYAEAPIGDLRFRPPVGVTTWNGTLNATQFGNICPQNPESASRESGDNEDCLTLNVYVPEVHNEKGILPVMIYIHGGRFTNGYARLYEPFYLLEEDVILVVPQFRLGPLGLLCLQTDEVPGNVQFLDQIMAMRWVRDNIGYFGGDPDQVTLFGQSAGAATVNLHQFSPLSKGLFHGAIIQSGSAFGSWVMDYAPLDTAAKLGAVVGCTQTDPTELAACFKGLEVQTLLDGFDKYLGLYTLGGLQAIGGHRAVVQAAGAQRFLEEDPSRLLARSEYSKMPMIGGVTKHDGDVTLSMYYSNYLASLVNDTDFLIYNLTSFLISVHGVADESGGVSHTFAKTYFNESKLGNFTEMLPGILDIASVLAFKAPVFRMLQANSRVNTSYLYSFGYFGESTKTPNFGLPFLTGIGHGDELNYLFPALTTLSEDDLRMAKRIVSLWTSFAITGKPTVDGQRWEAMSTAFGPYLTIEEEFSDGTNFLAEYTIGADEGLTAVERSLAVAAIVPQSVLIIAVALFSTSGLLFE